MVAEQAASFSQPGQASLPNIAIGFQNGAAPEALLLSSSAAVPARAAAHNPPVLLHRYLNDLCLLLSIVGLGNAGGMGDARESWERSGFTYADIKPRRRVCVTSRESSPFTPSEMFPVLVTANVRSTVLLDRTHGSSPPAALAIALRMVMIASTSASSTSLRTWNACCLGGSNVISMLWVSCLLI